LILNVTNEISVEERNHAAHGAALDISDTLARVTADLAPPEKQVFEFTPVDPTLPKVVYISCLRSPQHYSGSLTASWMSIYGLTRLTPPWPIHPNELLDGAISGPTSSHSATTSWTMVNNPIVLDLNADHGRRVNFAGCIAIRTRWSEQTEKELTALQAAKLAQLLGATGAIITYDAGGNDFIEVIHTVRAYERIGVEAVLLTTETPPEAEGPPLLEPLPEAVAIVSTDIGRPGLEPLALPAPARVLGGSELMATASKPRERIPSNSPLNFHRWSDHYGFGSESAFEYRYFVDYGEVAWQNVGGGTRITRCLNAFPVPPPPGRWKTMRRSSMICSVHSPNVVASAITCKACCCPGTGTRP
jgi:hypothetical protein